MDEYYAMEEAELSPEDRERRGSIKKRFGTVFLILGLAAAVAAGVLTWSNIRDDKEAGEASLGDLLKMEEMLGIDADGDGRIGTTPVDEASSGRAAADGRAEDTARKDVAGHAAIYETNPGIAMPTVNVGGHTYIGVLSIPAIDRTLPVMDTWSYPTLKIAPNRFVGTVYAHDMVVCAHNYDRHFGLIKTLQEGDEVVFTDVYGDRFTYEVSEVTILKPTDVEEMKTPDDWDLTLFTCTIGGATRVTVRCVMTGSEEAKWTPSAKADLSGQIEQLQKQSESKAS